MDRDLAPGVITHAGYSACDHPQSVLWEGSSLPISRIIKEWREPGSQHYLVETNGGMQFKLTFAETSQRWLVSRVHIKN